MSTFGPSKSSQLLLCSSTPSILTKISLAFSEETPNADAHFCVGDAVKWSGIKRCGGAMHSGHYSACNIYHMVFKNATGQEPTFKELREVPPMIALAVGKKAVASGPEGTVSGEDSMKAYFRDDLGFESKHEHFIYTSLLKSIIH
jgi:hypothetical protein